MYCSFFHVRDFILPALTSQENAENKVQSVCDEHNLTFTPFVFISSKMKIELTCSHGHITTREYCNLTSRRGGCTICSGKRIPLDPEKAKMRVLELCNEFDYSIVGEFNYKNSHTPLTLKCDKDGHVWDSKYTSFVNTGYRCAKCNGTAKVTSDELHLKIKTISEKHNHKIHSYTLLDKGVRNTKIKYECSNGHEKEVTLAAYFRESGCLRCTNRRSTNKYSPEEIVKFVINLCKEKKYTLIGIDNYNNKSSTKISLKCNTDSYEWTTSINHLTNGTTCPRCNSTGKLTPEEITTNVKNVCEEKSFSIVDDIPVGNHNKLFKLKCSEGHTFDTTYTKLIKRGSGCYHCTELQRRTTDEANAIVVAICENSEFRLFEKFDYVNIMTPIKVQCIKDDYVWNTTYAHFTRGKQCCPRCNGQEIISQEEAEKNIKDICLTRGYELTQPYIHDGIMSRIHLECTKDGSKWSPIYQAFVNKGTGCPTCAGREQTYAYISSIKKENIDGTFDLIGYKYGIETILGSRTYDQDRRSIHKIERLSTYIFEHTNDCKAAEYECCSILKKKNIGNFGMSGIISKEEMQDGFTETTTVDELEFIIETYKKFGGVEI